MAQKFPELMEDTEPQFEVALARHPILFRHPSPRGPLLDSRVKH